MCEFCKSKVEAYGYCVMCGKAICKDCANPNDQKTHPECGPKTRPQPMPVPEPEAAPEE